jgi:hypothetical protein
VFVFKAEEFNLVGLVLGLLLQTTSPGSEFVFLLPGLWPHCDWQLAHWRHVVDDPAKFVQLLANVVQLLGVWSQIISITFSGLAAKILDK